MTETVLHGFGGADEGAQPAAGLIFDSDGALYGTTIGGAASCAEGVLCGGSMLQLK